MPTEREQQDHPPRSCGCGRRTNGPRFARADADDTAVSSSRSASRSVLRPTLSVSSISRALSAGARRRETPLDDECGEIAGDVPDAFDARIVCRGSNTTGLAFDLAGECEGTVIAALGWRFEATTAATSEVSAHLNHFVSVSSVNHVHVFTISCIGSQHTTLLADRPLPTGNERVMKRICRFDPVLGAEQ
jgi:hypothetical protein